MVKTITRFALTLLNFFLWVTNGSCEEPTDASIKKRDANYLVVSLVDESSEFFPAAKMLSERHSAEIVRAAPASLESISAELKRRKPECVAIVVGPKDLDVNLVNRLVALSSQVDEDPFPDFAWGVITGRDGVAAQKLVRNSEANQRQDVAPSIAMFGVNGGSANRSTSTKAVWPLRKGVVPVTSFMSSGATDEQRDNRFIADSMPKLSQSPIILLASHGYPDGLVGGPKAVDLRGVDLSRHVMLNIACYTGVTNVWYEDDYQTGKLRRRSVDPDQSFCLQAIDCGVAGYFAYASPRPAGPTMMGESLLIASSGQSLGELFRESLHSVVLAHLMTGDDAIPVEPLADGNLIDRQRLPGDIVKRLSTGGVLFGDPAFRPFSEKPNSDPREVIVYEHDERLEIEMKIGTPLFHFFASDQINYWDNRTAAMRMECKVPLGDRYVEEVSVLSLPHGISSARYVAAEDQEAGKRFLRIKLNFEQPSDQTKLIKLSQKGLTARLNVSISKNRTLNRTPIRGDFEIGK